MRTTRTGGKTTFLEFVGTHRTWQKGKKTLGWWRRETGYCNYSYARIRYLSGLPHPCPGFLTNSVAIDILYLLHLDYALEGVTSVFIHRQLQDMRKEVFKVLYKAAKEKGIKVTTKGKFPWSSPRIGLTDASKNHRA